MSASQSITIHRTYQMRGHTCKTGYARIREVLGVCQRLYNSALAERIAVYRVTGKTMGKYAQFKWLTGLRKNDQHFSDIDVNVERGALVRLDRAYKAFFRRVKAGDGYGFPRFKPWQRYQCIELATVSEWMVKGNCIKIKGLPIIHIRPERSLPADTPKSLRLVLRGKVITVDMTYAEEVEPLPANDCAVGIDLGVNKRATLSTGETVRRRKTNRARQRVLQRSVARKCKGGSNRRNAVAKLARFKRREQVVNRNDCHIVTTDLVRRFGRIAIEKLQVQNMTRGNRGLNREILGQTWGILRQQLAYKVEWTGRKLAEVNPRYTSRTCSECGEVGGKPRVYRLFQCSDCGHTEDRDVNAAKNILHRAWGFWRAGPNVAVVNASVP